MPVHGLLIKTKNSSCPCELFQPNGSLRAGPKLLFLRLSPHHGLFHVFEEWQLETLKGETVFSNGTSRAKGIKQDEPARPRWARPELAGSRCPCHTPCWVSLLQSQPGRLEPQVFGQEHGEDAAQVVHRRGVQIGLRVVSRVPDRGEGRGDEVEHRDPSAEEGDVVVFHRARGLPGLEVHHFLGVSL